MAGKLNKQSSNQLSFDTRRRARGIGGWRPNAGRKKKPGSVSHDARVELKAREPQHVTLRIVANAGSISRGSLMQRIRACIAAAHKTDFRIVEFNVLSNHVHLITEAASKRALARGIQGFCVRLARAVNSALNRTGKLFAQRYHVRYLTNPTQVRNTLRYVLLNRKHHAPHETFSRTWFDGYSSAPWFEGWSAPLSLDRSWREYLARSARPTARAQTWLLTVGWRKVGLLRVDDSPA